MNTSDWHGKPEAELQASGEVPPRPADFAPMRCGPPDHTETYAHVHYSGNYGGLCLQFQTADDYGITAAEAREKAWTLFGVCHHTITYFNERGQIVAQE